MKFKELINTLYDMKVPIDYDIVINLDEMLREHPVSSVAIDNARKIVVLS